jgi:FAD synthase
MPVWADPFKSVDWLFSSARACTHYATHAADLRISEEHALPPQGTYACRANIGKTIYCTIAHMAPSARNGNGRIIELSLPNFAGDWDGQKLTLELIERRQPEAKDAATEALITSARHKPANEMIDQIAPAFVW